MITLKEFRERRTVGTLTQSLAELTFAQLFGQWMELDGKLTHGEAAGYASEARELRNIVGPIRANEIMDEVRNENK